MLHVLKAAGGSVQRRLRENAAISVGRLATVQPSALAVHLKHFLGDWCVTLATITVRTPSTEQFPSSASSFLCGIFTAQHSPYHLTFLLWTGHSWEFLRKGCATAA